MTLFVLRSAGFKEGIEKIKLELRQNYCSNRTIGVSKKKNKIFSFYLHIFEEMFNGIGYFWSLATVRAKKKMVSHYCCWIFLAFAVDASYLIVLIIIFTKFADKQKEKEKEKWQIYFSKNCSFLFAFLFCSAQLKLNVLQEKKARRGRKKLSPDSFN